MDYMGVGMRIRHLGRGRRKRREEQVMDCESQKSPSLTMFLQDEEPGQSSKPVSSRDKEAIGSQIPVIS